MNHDTAEEQASDPWVEHPDYLIRRCAKGTREAMRLGLLARLCSAVPLAVAWYAAMRDRGHGHRDAAWFALGMGAAVVDGPRAEAAE